MYTELIWQHGRPQNNLVYARHLLKGKESCRNMSGVVLIKQKTEVTFMLGQEYFTTSIKATMRLELKQ